MKSIFFALIAFPVSLSALAGEEGKSVVVVMPPVVQRQLTGNLSVDLFGKTGLTALPLPQDQDQTAVEEHHKSPWLAAGLSLLVPGAGEFYDDSYLKAGIFIAVDVTMWVLASHFDKKGNTQTDTYEVYANQNWSVVRYAQYALDHLATGDPAQYSGLFIPGTQNRPPWEQVNWDVLNRMERDISATDVGKYYSHTLPPYADQQYYELIGKYKQFNQGWDDAPTLYNYPDPETAHFDFYQGERAQAEDYYKNATRFVTLAIVNHVLSAIDAAWTASTYNHNIHASIQMQTIPLQYGYTRVPVAHVEYTF